MTIQQKHIGPKTGTAKLSGVADALSETLSDSDVRGLTVDAVEAILDSMLAEGVVKDIPVIGALYKLGKASISIRDLLFIKKLLYFLSGVADIPAATRAEMIAKIDASAKYKVKVGEKLLYVLDKAADHEHAQIISRLFRAFISGDLQYEEFLRACRTVEHIVSQDFLDFVEEPHEKLTIEEVAGAILSAGLFELQEVEIGKAVDTLGRETGVIDGAQVWAQITPLGKKIREIFK